MYYYIFIAFSSGIIIGIARVINARLSESNGPMVASLWNHIIGFFILLLIIMITSGFGFLTSFDEVPLVSYLGGVIGACFVALNSFVLPRIGAMRTILLVIGGQMIGASILELLTKSITSISMQILGVALIIVGITIARKATLLKESQK